MNERLRTDGPEFAALFANITKSWFRLETLQSYDVADEASQFEAFLAGEVTVPRDDSLNDWADMVGAHVAAGRVLQRVHIVTEPLSDYVKYEIAWGYPFTVAAGEDIRLVVQPAGQWPLSLPKNHDFWMFDGEVWAMAYDVAGRPQYIEHLTDPDEVARHHDWQRTALDLSVPVSDYIAASPELRQRAPLVGKP